MDTLTAAVTNLISEYDSLDGQVSRQAPARRALAMEQVTAAVFSRLDAELDPWGWDDIDEDIAGETLGYSLHISDLLTAAMLDFRAGTQLHRCRPENRLDRLRVLLLEIIDIAVQELMGGVDQGETGDGR